MLNVIKYDVAFEKKWDEFVEGNAINGTFLQEWRFLNYHAKDRFEDHSLMFFEENKLVSVCPACVICEDGEKIFYSHMGSTYGGLLICKEMLRVEKVKLLLDEFEGYLKREKFSKCILKPTMNLLCSYPQDILEFFMHFYQYQEYKELNIYIDYKKYNTEDIIINFSKMKKRNIKKCLNLGFELRELTTKSEIEDFHRVITSNLLKYSRKPIHIVDELCDLKNRLNDNIEFYGAYLNDKLMAGTMVFLFDNVKCAHTQYLAADPEYKHLNPMAFIYYKMVEMYAEREFNFLSWGIATEHLGSGINYSLANNKEEFGSLHSINYIYEKNFFYE